jgi:IS30 family transposase
MLHRLLRQSPKLRRKRYRSPDSRGVLPGKRHISERPQGAENRSEPGHFELDLVLGHRGRGFVMTLVDRKTRFTLIAKLRKKTNKEVNQKLIPLVRNGGSKS